MATETRPPRTETDEDLLTRAPAHDGVATQRDLRETERYLADRFDTRLDKSEERMNAKMDRMNAKMDRMTWLIISGLGVAVTTLIAILVQV